MSLEVGTATGCDNLLDLLDTFLRKGHSLTPQYTGTGTGTITALIGTSSSVLETITVTFTSSTAFGVSGSVTGSMSTGTVGTTFTHAKVTFKVVAGGVAFTSGDTIVFVLTPPWTASRSSAGSEYIWTAPGDDGSGEIYVGAKRFHDTGADYDNWRLNGFTGFDSGSAFTAQPGAMPSNAPVLPLWSSSIPYWFMATGRRVVIIAKVSSQYECAYLGLLDAYASPDQFPYPLVVGGSMGWTTEPLSTSANWRYSYSGVEHRAFPMPNHNNTSGPAGQLRLRKPDGTWFGFHDGYSPSQPGNVWPFSSNDFGTHLTDLRPNLDGSYPTFPCVLVEGSDFDGVTNLPRGQNVFGELAGVRATTGHLNGSENTIDVGRETWLVVQNVTATTKHDYFCVRMD
jgi:hypothetical protein